MSESFQPTHRPTVLMILDGFGITTPSRGNAVSESKTPHLDHLFSSYPAMTLQASGEATGLPWGEVGNSEVGHSNIGAGRIVTQELTRINQEIANGTFFNNSTLLEAIEQVKKNKSSLHLLGMVSSGGVHSYNEHLYALLELAKKHDVKNVYIHAILDGRDVPFASGAGFIEKLLEKIKIIGVGQIATLSGRFYTMDRDNRWDRIQKAYDAIVKGVSENKYKDPLAAIKESYDQKIYDEQIVPIVLTKGAGTPIATIQPNDAVIFFNFRADRARQLTMAMSLPTFEKFERTHVAGLFMVTMTQYEKTLPVHVAYSPQTITNCLSEVISNAKLTQLHVAETEKYAHITYFLNGGQEQPFVGETRILIPSPSVSSYDQKPEMSARDITANVVKAISDNTYDFIALNFANADMVGHTGKLKETIRAVETLDQCIGQISQAVLLKKGAMLITADHGNAENKIDLQTGHINKEHTNNPVPCVIIAPELEGRSIGIIDISGNDLSVLEPSGILSDVAPTILSLLGLEKPAEMTGRTLLDI